MLETIRGLVRPTLTWLGFGVVSGVVGYLSLHNKTMPPDWYISMVALMVGYWFGQREASKPNGEKL